jgi:tetratricopeptide (TPR) repeat protein
MGDRYDTWVPGKRGRLRDDFVNGLRCFNSKDFDGALMFFRIADDGAELDDAYQSRYTSFHGLSRVFTGDRNGVKLCRKAAVGETRDVEVYYNLAMAEYRLDFHDSALMALRRGLNIDPDHGGLQRLQRELSWSGQRGSMPGFNGDNIVSRLLGKFLGRSG